MTGVAASASPTLEKLMADRAELLLDLAAIERVLALLQRREENKV